MPRRFADFLEPRLDHFGTVLAGQQRSRRLTRPQEGRDVDVVEMFIGQPLTELFGLGESPSGEGWVNNAEAVFHPFGFSVTNEQKFHARQTNPGRSRRR